MSNLGYPKHGEKTEFEWTLDAPAAPVPASTGRDANEPESAHAEAGFPCLCCNQPPPVAARELDVEAERREFEAYVASCQSPFIAGEEWSSLEIKKAWLVWLAARSAAQSTAPALARWEFVGFLTQCDVLVESSKCTREQAKIYGWREVFTAQPTASAPAIRTVGSGNDKPALAKYATLEEYRAAVAQYEAAPVSTEQAGDAPAAHLYEWFGEEGSRKKGDLIARTPSELGGNIDLYPHCWKRVGALVQVAPSPNNSPVGGKD